MPFICLETEGKADLTKRGDGVTGSFGIATMATMAAASLVPCATNQRSGLVEDLEENVRVQVIED